MPSKRLYALILIAAGSLLLLSGASYALFSQAVNSPEAAPLPEQLAGLATSRMATGWQAVDEITRLHRKEFPLTSGAVGIYGPDGQATLWVSGAPLGVIATRILFAMRDKIAEGNSPFTPTGERRDGKRVIYGLDGMEQKHFYFQSGNLVIWLAANPAVAEQALTQTLEFYP